MSDNLKKVLEESSISQLLLTVVFSVGALTVQIMQGAVPDWLIGVVFTLVGFYFGAKSNSLTNKIADTVKTVSQMRPPEGPVAGVVTTTVVTDVAPVAAVTYVETTREALPAPPSNMPTTPTPTTPTPTTPATPTTPEVAAATAAAGLPPAGDVIEVKDGKPLTDVKAGLPVSAVIVDTKSVPKRTTAKRAPVKRTPPAKKRPAVKKKLK